MAAVTGGIVLAMLFLLTADSAATIVGASQSEALELRADGLVVMLWKEPLHLELRDPASGRTLLEEYPVERRGALGPSVGSLGFLVAPDRRGGVDPAPGRPRWHRVTQVLRLVPRDDGIRVIAATDDPSGRRLEIELWFTAPGALTVRVRPQPAEGALEVAEGLHSDPAEHYLGLGARFTSLDARGSEVRSHVNGQPDTLHPGGNHLPVPFFVSSRSYGVQAHGMDESVFQLNTVRPDAAIFKTRGAALHFTVFTAETPLQVVAAHAKAAGPPAVPPRWAFGVWKTVLGGEERVLDEVERIRRERLPVTVLWSYDMVDEARNLGWKRWVYRAAAPGRYGDLARFTRFLRSQGYRVLGYLSPEFSINSPLFPFAVRRGYFVRDASGRPYLREGMQGGPVALVDFTNPDAVGWWQGLTTSILTDLGFDGWMQDGGDGAPGDGIYWSGVAGPAARNSYPIAYARATRAAAVQVRPDYVSFMRTGFAGSQRDTPITWPCDNVFSWSRRDGMPAALRAALNGSLSGFPFWAPDIGGYFGCGRGDSADEELWIRWAQLGALHPVMRDHLGDKCGTAIDVWTTPATLDTFRRYAALHQRLVPYIYGLALEAAATGRPIMRPVALLSPADPRAYADEFTYLLGDDLLVAPVVEPGARMRQLFLPEGEWIDWWGRGRHRGPGVVTVAAPLKQIPLLVRAGATLPIGDPWPELAGDSGDR